MPTDRAFWSAPSIGAADRQNPPQHRFAAPPSDGVVPHRGGVGHKIMGGRIGLGGRRPDPCLLVPNASRQEAEANSSKLSRSSMSEAKAVVAEAKQRLHLFAAQPLYRPTPATMIELSQAEKPASNGKAAPKAASKAHVSWALLAFQDPQAAKAETISDLKKLNEHLSTRTPLLLA